MDDIVIYRKHGKTLAEARKSAERMAAELNEEFELNCAWQGNVLTFERLGVSGKLELDDQEALIQCLARLPENAETAYIKGQHANRRIKALCDYRAMVESYLQIYREGGRR